MGGFFGQVGNFFKGGGLPGMAYRKSGGSGSGISNFLFGNDSEFNPYDQNSLSSLQQLLGGGGLQNNQLYGAGSNYLQQLLSNDPSAFAAFEAPYMQQFEQEIVPGIAERFAGVGAGRSSGLNNSLAQAGKQLSTNLAGLRSGLQMQALPQAYQYAQGPLQNMLQAAGMIPGQYYENPGQQGLVQSGFNAFAQGLGRSAGGGF